jgi:exodeoxyribonuclease VII small subunit
VAKKKTKANKAASPSFEQSLAELEAIVADLEGGDLGLAAAVARYESGVKHLQACYQLLDRAERRIERVTGVDAEGNPATEPFDDAADAGPSLEGGSRRPQSGKPPRQGGRRRRSQADVDEGETLF